MTREMAMIGIPTISVYQESLLEVDKILISKNMMIHDPELNTQKMKSYITTLVNKASNPELMRKGKDAYELFISEIENFENNKKI